MAKKIYKENESKLYRELNPKGKSYTVEVLHFYHFRRNRLQKAWSREETITWELIRALDILPREFFLHEFLKQVTKNYKEFSSLASSFERDYVSTEVIAYPRLNLKGSKKNSASDIEISNDNSCLWIEAKTLPTKKIDFHKQLSTQKEAQEIKYATKLCGLIALIPEKQQCDYPFITWSNALYAFVDGNKKLEAGGNQLFQGYRKIAMEMINRIEYQIESE